MSSASTPCHRGLPLQTQRRHRVSRANTYHKEANSGRYGAGAAAWLGVERMGGFRATRASPMSRYSRKREYDILDEATFVTSSALAAKAGTAPRERPSALREEVRSLQGERSSCSKIPCPIGAASSTAQELFENCVFEQSGLRIQRQRLY